MHKRTDPRAVDEGRILSAMVPEALAGSRLDQALARLFPDYSRTALKACILAGGARLNDRPARPRERVAAGDRVEVSLRPAPPAGAPAAQAIELSVVHEDAELLVVDKPAGLVVHPGAGNPDRTLMNALLHHDPDLAALPRAGIVHRLDKDTSGLMVLARSRRAHTRLVEALQARSVQREYEAVVNGVLVAGGRLEAPIGRHPRQRTKMAVVEGGRPAATRYRVRERFRAHTHLAVTLESGRTHQIRVHLAHLGHPVAGDVTYGGRPRLPPAPAPALMHALRGLDRQALHAARLRLIHPATGEALSFEAPLPPDLAALLAALREDRDGA